MVIQNAPENQLFPQIQRCGQLSVIFKYEFWLRSYAKIFELLSYIKHYLAALDCSNLTNILKIF